MLISVFGQIDVTRYIARVIFRKVIPPEASILVEELLGGTIMPHTCNAIVALP